MIPRRTLLVASSLAASAVLNMRAAAAAAETEAAVLHGLANLERRHGGKLGVAILDTATMRLIAHRGDERFPLCSTHKFLTAAFVLARVDRQEESLSRRVVYAQDDLVAYSPITKQHVGQPGMTMGEICEAAMTVSDNTAANLLLDSFGGPAALTAYLRSLGDAATRLDRREPELNEAKPGDPRDTTTPIAMLETMRKTVLGGALSAPSRKRLAAWLVACRTGDSRLRAAVPQAWRVGDKTGSGGDEATNDIAVMWPPGRPPILVTAYYLAARASDDQRNAVLEAVGRRAAAA